MCDSDRRRKLSTGLWSHDCHMHMIRSTHTRQVKPLLPAGNILEATRSQLNLFHLQEGGRDNTLKISSYKSSTNAERERKGTHVVDTRPNNVLGNFSKFTLCCKNKSNHMTIT